MDELQPSAEPPPTFQAKALAWAVHGFTASGAVLTVFALVAISGQRWIEAMLWLFAALLVDGIDGTLARAARVPAVAPRIDGAALDLVIDYMNYVLVPTMFLIEAKMLPPGLELPLAGLIQLSSLYIFARRDMKTADGYFRGFPALWNIVVFYLFIAEIPPTVAALAVAALVVLTFAPIHVIHPFRARDFGRWPAVLALVWTIATLAMLLPASWDLPRLPLLVASSLSAAIIIALGLYRTFTGERTVAA